MIEIIAHNLAPIIFVSLVVFLLYGYPVSFALAANGLIFFVIGVWLAPYSNGEITLDWPLLGTMPQRLWGVLSNETLLAIPFFTFMGIILERSGMAEDLLDTIGQLFGPIRGGLAFAVVLVGALLAATTGVVAASVIAMGLISLPIMLRYGYDRRTATGVIAASGTLAQIIPPSLVLIVLADQLGRSVGDMYRRLSGLYLHDCDLPAAQGARPSARGADAGRGRHLAARGAGCGRGHRLCRALLLVRCLGCQCRCAGGHHRHAGGVLLCAGRPLPWHQPSVAPGATGHHGADPTPGADLPGAGHNLHRPCDPDRRRGDGRGGRDDPGLCQGPLQVPGPAVCFGRHHATVGLRHVRADRRADVRF